MAALLTFVPIGDGDLVILVLEIYVYVLGGEE